MTDQLGQEIKFLDNEIETLRQELYSEIADANAGVEKAVNRNNMRRILAAIFNGVGGLFQIYGTAYSAATSSTGGALDVPLIARLVGRSLRRGTQVTSSLRGIKEVAQKCGVADYERVVDDFALFFHLESLFSQYHYIDKVEYHPEVLKLMACEFGDTIKQQLSCLTTSSSGTSLNSAIDDLVLTINTRIAFTQKIMEFP